MTENEKMLGEERRQLIVETLRTASRPIPGRELGEMTNVSRQVIVGDITLLKARNQPIMATSQGYVYMHAQLAPERCEKTIVCRHAPEQTELELNIFVDNGVTVKDVKIEHPVYGDLTASIMVSNRNDVKEFIEKVSQVNGVFLLKLTDAGIHLHTVMADNEQQIINAEDALRKADILVE
ncbi:transcription repressor NadR [Sporosarcina limicola]|uniref:Transcriptional regulator of NAD metabolism n=1 Tax=Sporosarcina limicola TaxID=34101 RepID=A0A927RDH0_9BACL|nr:transcription repressor NadR [Sporosarcina limicola]MBE1553667.1 transcriptional regulator of NAD metabolism [Sporosarcina limicola]